MVAFHLKYFYVGANKPTQLSTGSSVIC